MTGGLRATAVKRAHLACEDCDWEADGWHVTEYGAGWTEPECCPTCGGELRFEGDPDGPDEDRAYDLMRDEEMA